MRAWFVMLLFLLSGCAGEASEPSPTLHAPVTETEASPEAPAAVDDAPAPWNTTAFNDSFDLAASATMPAPLASEFAWFMAYGADVDAIELDDLSGIMIEILYTSDAGGGGAAWLTEPGEPTDPADPVASVQADEGVPTSHWVSAEDFASLEEPSVYVSGGGRDYYAVHGSIRLVVTAFYGAEAPEGFTAL